MKKQTRIKLLVLIGLLALFVVVASLVLTDTIIGFENSFYDFTHSTLSNGMTTFMKIITHIGAELALCGIILILLIVPKTTKTYGLPVLFTLGINAALCGILKVIFCRPRPILLQLVTAQGYSFPSGHAANSTAVFVAIALIAGLRIKDRRIKIPLLVLCGLMPFLIGYSRVYLGVHWLGCVIGGWVLGIAIALAVNLLWAWFNKKYPRAFNWLPN